MNIQETYNYKEVRYISVRYALQSLDNSKLIFSDWLHSKDSLRSSWRQEANEELTNINDEFNEDEIRHIAVNFAIYCMLGYQETFDKWFQITSPSWRQIANQKP